MKELRLFFEPKPGTNVNHNAMFKHYADNYLADTGLEWGGYISMDLKEKVGSRMEPVYQYIERFENSQDEALQTLTYIRNNPMEGYYVHIYTKSGNENLKHSEVVG